jgi:large subunit ribosomal protein L21
MTDPTRPTDDQEAEADAAAEAPETDADIVAAAATDDEVTETAEADAEAEAEPVEAEAEPVEADEEPAEVAAVAAVAEPAPARTERRPRGPRPYAIIETGGKQYRVSVGDTISVERLDGDEGADITLERVLLLGGDGTPRVGTPVVAGATVSARIEEQFRGEKITIFKYKPKKRYRRRMGHRQSLTRLEITGINA